MSDLNRQIAEALGWRDLKYEALVFQPDDDGPEPITHSILTGVPPDKTRHHVVPRWREEAGAALALCLEIGEAHGWDLLINTGENSTGRVYTARFWSRGVPAPEQVMGWLGDTPARALANLALAALSAAPPD